jgi:hypothetical protein
MTSEENIWVVPNHLCDIPHKPLLTSVQAKNLTRVDPRTIQGEIVDHRRDKAKPPPRIFRPARRG